MGTLFKIMHWPLANALGLSAVAILTLVYLPVNLFTGIRNPDTRVNTIVSSVLLVAGCGLFLSLVRSPQSSQSHYMQQTAAFVDLHEILNREKDRNNQSGHELSPEAKDVLQKCDQLEKYLLQRETGSKNLNTGNSGGIMITDNYLNVFIRKNNEGVKLLEDFKQSISDYNAASAGKNKVIDIEEIPAANLHDGRVIDALESLVRIQLHVLQGV